jgi:hypothetical protein
MREWSSGTQTDFTNYAARRLAERGLLREEDPIKLQRAVTEIAYSYARGGSSATGYVPSDSPLGPSTAAARSHGLARFIAAGAVRRHANGGRHALRQQTATNEAEIRARQTRSAPYPTNRWAMTWPVASAPAKPKRRPRSTRGARRSRRTPERSARTTRPRCDRQDQLQPRRQPSAVWDTVGANASQPDLGTPPKVEPIGEWHFDKDGVPADRPGFVRQKAPARTRFRVMRCKVFCYSTHHPGRLHNDPLPPLYAHGPRQASHRGRFAAYGAESQHDHRALQGDDDTRVDLPAIEQLCRLFNCQVGDLFEYVQDGREVNP